MVLQQTTFQQVWYVKAHIQQGTGGRGGDVVDKIKRKVG